MGLAGGMKVETSSYSNRLRIAKRDGFFDLIHELYHAGQNPSSDVLELIETAETSTERRNSNEEIAASEFAGDVILGGRRNRLQRCA